MLGGTLEWKRVNVVLEFTVGVYGDPGESTLVLETRLDVEEPLSAAVDASFESLI